MAGDGQNDSTVALLDQPQANGKMARRDRISASEIRRRWTSATRAQRTQQVQFWLNRSFLFGDQWVQFSKVMDRVENSPRDDSRVQATDNRLWPSYRTIAAKALRRELVFEVDPTEADDASIGGAEIGESVLLALHRDQNWEGLRAEHFYATFLGGTGVLALDWDPTKGVTLGQTDGGRDFGTGEVVVSALSIVEVGTEPGVRDIEKARWWVRAQALPPKQVQDIYELAKPPAADAMVGIEPVSERFAAESGNVVTNLTLVLHYYERPSNLHKQGQVAVVVGNEIVDGPYPWPFPFKDRLNLTCARETRVDGRWSGNTIFTAARPVQTLHNAAESSIAEHMKLAGNARLLMPDSALDGIEELTDLPAEIVPWSGQGTPPGWLAPPSMPPWWIQQPDRTAKAIDDILGVHDVSRGDTQAGGASSGVALSILSEQDDTPIAGLSKELAECWGRMASLVLETYADKVTETRTARVTVGTKMPLLVKWTGRDLAGQTSATVPLDSVLPRSRAAQMQWAVSLVQSGVIPAGNTALFAHIAELPDQEAIFEGIDPHVAKARRENLQLSIGQVVMPQHFDNHPAHMTEHLRQQCSARYDRSSPALRKIIDDHQLAHQHMEAEAAAQQMLQRQVAPELQNSASAHQPTPLGGPGPMAPPAGPVAAPPTQPAPQPVTPGQQGPLDATAPPDMGGM